MEIWPQFGRVGEDTERGEGVGREAHRHRGLGQRNGFAGVAHDIDVAIVGELWIEEGGDAAKESAAGIGGELGVSDLAGFLRGAKGVARKEAVRIGDAALREGEAM